MNELYKIPTDRLYLNGDFANQEQTLTQLTHDHLLRVPNNRVWASVLTDTALTVLPGFAYDYRPEIAEYSISGFESTDKSAHLDENRTQINVSDEPNEHSDLADQISSSLGVKFYDSESSRVVLRDPENLASSLFWAGYDLTKHNELFITATNLEHSSFHTSFYFKTASPEGIDEITRVSWFPSVSQHERQHALTSSEGIIRKMAHYGMRAVVKSPALRIESIQDGVDNDDPDPTTRSISGYNLDSEGKIVEIDGKAYSGVLDITDGAKRRSSMFTAIEETIMPVKSVNNIMRGIGKNSVADGKPETERYMHLIRQINQDNMIVVPGFGPALTKRQLSELVNTASLDVLANIQRSVYEYTALSIVRLKSSTNFRKLRR